MKTNCKGRGLVGCFDKPSEFASRPIQFIQITYSFRVIKQIIYLKESCYSLSILRTCDPIILIFHMNILINKLSKIYCLNHYRLKINPSKFNQTSPIEYPNPCPKFSSKVMLFYILAKRLCLQSGIFGLLVVQNL